MIIKTDNIVIDLSQVEAIYKSEINQYIIELYIHGRSHTLTYPNQILRNKVYEKLVNYVRQQAICINGENGDILPQEDSYEESF